MDQIKKTANKLEPLGLSEKQARVYVATLFLGSAPVQQIAKQADINRPTAYVILEELEKMGLVSESTDAKKTVYIAEDPEAITRWLEKKEREIETKKEEAKDLVSNLKDIKREEAPEAPIVKFYKGKEGIESINAYTFRKARPGSEIYAMTNKDEVLRIFPETTGSLPKARLKKKLSSKLLYSYSKGEFPSDPKLLRETKKLKEPVKADIGLDEDRATLIAYGGDPEELTGILIESPEIVGALRQLFELAWKNVDNN